MKLKYIEFVLENCDSIKIEGKYIGNFLVEDVKTSIRRVACNSIDKMDIANTVVIEIHKDADETRYEFGQTQCEGFKQKTFDRFKECYDITSINFELEENYVKENEIPCAEHYKYFVNWTGDSNYINDAQKVYLSENGNLYIVVADGKNIEDFFEPEIINSKEYTCIYY